MYFMIDNEYVSSEVKVTYQQMEDTLGRGFSDVETGEKPSPDRKLKLVIVGFDYELDCYQVSVRKKTKSDHEWYYPIMTNKTRKEQVLEEDDAPQECHLVTFRTPRGKVVNWNEKDMIFALYLEEWLSLPVTHWERKKECVTNE